MARTIIRTCRRSELARDEMPTQVAPMLATPGTLPRDEQGYGFEYKWDGVRTLCFLERGGLRLQSRNLLDVTHRYPELSPLSRSLRGRRVLLDGEIVAIDGDGRPNFSLLQRRMHVATVGRRAERAPVTYMIFDLLHLDGNSLLGVPYEQRREELKRLNLSGATWQTPPWYRGEGKSLLAASRAAGLEGIVAKRLGSLYEPGRRSRDWLKIKIRRRQEFVIGGWMPGEGAHQGLIGSLLVGFYSEPASGGIPGGLHFAGGVGTGFDAQDHRELLGRLRKLGRSSSPFVEKVPRRGAVWVEPALVAEVEFHEWTHGGIIRHPVYKGLRMDKAAREVVCEEPVGEILRRNR